MSAVVDVEGLSAQWLSEVLDRDVALHSCERIGTGQTAATYRLQISAEGLPPTMVAKVAAGDEAARRQVRGGARNEVGFYAALQATVDVRSPQCWHAVISGDALTFTLLLEDLAPRVPGVQADGCTPAHADAAVRNLAGLHAPSWNDASLYDQPFLRRSNAEGAAFLGGITQHAVPAFLAMFAADLAAEDVETLTSAAAAIESWLLLRPEPFALLHGDYRLDNLMFGDDVVAVDWQTLIVGPPTRDLAYFLGASLLTDDRRLHEEALVAAYHSELVRRGVADYPADRCFEDYRVGHLQGPMITMIGATMATAERTAQSDGMFLAMARRSCAAIRDLRSLELL